MQQSINDLWLNLHAKGNSKAVSHFSVLVKVHTGFGGDVLGADDLTVSLKGL